MAMGCSTNAIIHVIAWRAAPARHRPRRFRPHEPPRARDRQHPAQRRQVPDGRLLLRGRPARADEPHPDKLHLDTLTVTGRTLGENIAGAEVYNDDVIRTRDNALYQEGALAVLRGNIAPDGCVIKPSACEVLQTYRPGAGVRRLPVDEGSGRERRPRRHGRSCADPAQRGPQGGPGMPEWGMLPIPKKLVKQGVRDMLRMSDARMSGTSYGACILHVAPEAYIGGPFALVRTGDLITVDIDRRSIHLEVSDEELAAAARHGNRRRRATARLRLDVLAPYPPGQRRLRFRFPANRLRRSPGEPSIY
jgi:dihydroxy-acid dehydratase